MAILVTGAAGFIGFHTARVLLARGARVIGLDTLNSYYDPQLKRARLAQLEGEADFTFHKTDISDADAIADLTERYQDITHIAHLAAQPGVRYSLVDPLAYVQANLTGHVVMMEMARRLPKFEHFVYASSSSVYGDNPNEAFSVDDPADTPTSLYGATKRADELMASAYCNLFSIPMTGLRFFSVYGPWGRPDMAVYSFVKAIFEDKPITLYNGGEMWRDFTYVDDIIAGLLAALDRVPGGDRPHALYNLGNNTPVKVADLVSIMEAAIGKPARISPQPMPKTEMLRTCADIEASRADLGFEPKTPIDIGVRNFVDWYIQYTQGSNGASTITDPAPTGSAKEAC